MAQMDPDEDLGRSIWGHLDDLCQRLFSVLVSLWSSRKLSRRPSVAAADRNTCCGNLHRPVRGTRGSVDDDQESMACTVWSCSGSLAAIWSRASLLRPRSSRISTGTSSETWSM